MLEFHSLIRRRASALTRFAALLIPVICVILLLTQTAFAKTTYLINDGGKIVVHSTYSTDPEAILDEAGLELGEDDTYTTQSGFGISEITVQRRQTITITYGDNTLQVISYGETVEALLDRLNLLKEGQDVVSVSLDTETYDGLEIHIYRSVELEETYTTPIAYETVYCYDPSLAEGEEVMLIEGVDGLLLCTAQVHYLDGEEVSRVVTSENVTRQPVNAVIAVGTYLEQDAPETMPAETEPATEAPTQAATQATTEAATEATTAATEAATEPATEPSSNSAASDDSDGELVIGNGVIVTSDGQVLTYSDTLQVVATAYTSTDPGCSAYTATGTLCRVGAIAVDPRVIPYGTRMFIVSDDGEYIYGIAVAEDCGGSIKGNKIDLYFDTESECWAFGVRNCTVYFLD